MRNAFRILLLCIFVTTAAQAQTTTFLVHFSRQQPTNQLASEIYKPGFAAGIHLCYGDYVRLLLPIGYEQWKMKPDARSSNSMLDSMIPSRGDDPTINVFTGLGMEVGWPKNSFFRLSAATEGNLGLYVGKSHFLMVQQYDDEQTMEVHLSLAYSFSGRLDFRLFHDKENDASMFLFLKYDYRALPAAIQKNTFNCYSLGVAVSAFSMD